MHRFARSVLAIVCFALPALVFCEALAEDRARGIPKPLPGHPGNIFLKGEDVIVPGWPEATQWRAVDIDGKQVDGGTIVDGLDEISLGQPGIGWYRVEFLDEAGKQVGWTTAAVLPGLKEAVRDDSPVCVDSATAWFARRYQPEEKKHQEILANLERAVLAFRGQIPVEDDVTMLILKREAQG